MFRTSGEWTQVYRQRRALWTHDGHPKRPHALLTSGKHSDGFFNSELVMEDPILLDEASSDLVELLTQNGLDLNLVDRVVGPAMGAITLANDVARHISQLRGRACLRAYTEKEGEGESKHMVFKRTKVQRGEKILVVEDVLTTGGSILNTVEAVLDAGGSPVGWYGLLVNRSGQKSLPGLGKYVPLIDPHMQSWEAEACPFCQGGSEVLRPKGAWNWANLNATY